MPGYFAKTRGCSEDPEPHRTFNSLARKHFVRSGSFQGLGHVNAYHAISEVATISIIQQIRTTANFYARQLISKFYL